MPRYDQDSNCAWLMPTLRSCIEPTYYVQRQALCISICLTSSHGNLMSLIISILLMRKLKQKEVEGFEEGMPR